MAQRSTRRGHPFAFLVFLVLLAAGSLYAALSTVMRVDAIFLPGNELGLPEQLGWLPGLDAGDGLASANDRINVLVMGVDRRPHHDASEEGPPRSDSMFILSLDPASHSASVVAIPRDLYVEMPNPQRTGGLWDTRINTAYHYGQLYKYPGGGPALARETVEREFKVPIHYYAVIDWVAFADVIDALNGIEITVPETLRGVEAFNVRDGNAFTITIRAGRQPMDAITALAYARFRDDADGDFGRIQRQQQVMVAVMEKALGLGWVGRAPSLYAKFRGAVDTDLGAARLPGLAALMKQVGLENVKMTSLAGDHGENISRRLTPYGEDVLVPIWEKMGPALATALPDRRLQQEGAVVKLVNATGTRALAQDSADTLARYGFPPTYMLPYDNERVDRRTVTTITVYGDRDYTARRVADMLGVPRAPIEQRDEMLRQPGEPDIIVMLGSDVRLPDPDRYDSFTYR